MATSRTAQDLINSIKNMPLLAPIFQSQVSGWSLEPGLSIVNDAMGYWFGTLFAWKYNEIELAPFLVNSYQQDYATANTNIGYLTAGDCLDVNNTALAKAQPQVEVVKDLPRASTWMALPPMFYGVLKFQICWCYNSQLYYGAWGVPNTGSVPIGVPATAGWRGNNPQANSVYLNPITTGGQMPFNPISQIIDTNGNYLVLTGYGTEGGSAPVAPPNTTPGIGVSGPGATTVWTVVDPGAQGFRIWPPASQSGVVWQFNLRAQAKPPVPFTSLNTPLTPIPDEYYHNFRQGCIAMAYAYSSEEKVREMHEDAVKLWLDRIMSARMQGDREPENHSFIPTGGVVASVSGAMPITPGNPYGTA